MAFQTYKGFGNIFNSFMRRYEELGRKIHNSIKAVESGHRS